MIQSQCGICSRQNFKPVFDKKSKKGETFHIVICKNCHTLQTLPRPSISELSSYYQDSYFERRTDRGYNNYKSASIQKEISRVFELNLTDLNFFSVEPSLLAAGARSLDVGCAAGYFVEFLAKRGWHSEGIEISKPMAEFAQSRGLKVSHGDFLESATSQHFGQYNLISLWASLEHFAEPVRLIQRLSESLKPGGSLILSTCRRGLLSWLTGPNWRYMNVPEHLFFFSLPGIQSIFAEYGFECIKSISYGSGFTTKQNASIGYRFAKRIFDPLVKVLNQGDMMALHFRKR